MTVAYISCFILLLVTVYMLLYTGHGIRINGKLYKLEEPVIYNSSIKTYVGKRSKTKYCPLCMCEAKYSAMTQGIMYTYHCNVCNYNTSII